MAAYDAQSKSPDFFDIDEDRSAALQIQPPQAQPKKKKSKHKHKNKHSRSRDGSEKGRRTVTMDSDPSERNPSPKVTIWDRVGPGDWERHDTRSDSRQHRDGTRDDRRSGRERQRDRSRREREDRHGDKGRKQDEWGRGGDTRHGNRGSARYDHYDERSQSSRYESGGRYEPRHESRNEPRGGERVVERGMYSRGTERSSDRTRRGRSRSPLEREWKSRREDPVQPDRNRDEEMLEKHREQEEESRVIEDEREEQMEEGERRTSQSESLPEYTPPQHRSEEHSEVSEEEEQEAQGSEREDGERDKSSLDSSQSSDSDSGGSHDGVNEASDREEAEEKTLDPYRSKFDDPQSEEEVPPEESAGEENSDEYEEGYVVDSPERSPTPQKEELPPYYPALQGCRSVEEFMCLNRVEEGTYGVVYRAKDKKKDEVVALKRLKMEKEKEGFPITSLREINTLLKAQHPNIVTVREIVVGSNMDKIYIVMDFVEHDMKSLMLSMKQPFLAGEVKCLMIQLLRGVEHLHDNWIIHRDLKTSNLLLSHRGILKIADFGLAREYGSPLKPYTPIVVTLWYRSAELLLGVKQYSTAVDLWSVGCIFAELWLRTALWQGKSETEQLNKIFKDLGSPSEKIWPGVKELPVMKKCSFADHPYNNLMKRFGSYITELCFDLMNKMLTYNPGKRITAHDALQHDYFKKEQPRPIDPSMFPTWPARSEQMFPTKRDRTPKPPSGGKAYDKMLGDDDEKIGFQFTHASKGAAKGVGFSLKF